MAKGHNQLNDISRALAAHDIMCRRVEPYKDGRNRYGVWPRERKFMTLYTDDLDEAYILGLRLSKQIKSDDGPRYKESRYGKF